jgi:hypothetical protein
MNLNLKSFKNNLRTKFFGKMNAPEIVYKFRDWQNANHRNVLYHNEIYIASPADFNDPFDCRIIPDFSLLDNLNKKKEYLLTLRPATSSLDINQALNNLEEVIKNPDKYEKNYFDRDDKQLAVFCVSTRWDIIPLWSHYANLHTGFCVGFILEKVKSAFPFSKMGEVKYHKYPSIDPQERLDPKKYIGTSFKKTHYKSEDWEYEKEFRLTRLIEKEMTIQDRLVNLPNDAIAEITLGLKFPTIDISKIMELATFKKWSLYQAKRIPMKFGLDRERIN